MLNRREFIKFIASLGVFTLTPFRRLLNYNDPTTKEIKGELYGGFVLLPADAEVPPFIVPAKTKKPVEEGKSSTVYKEFKSIEDVRNHLKKPIYVIDETEQKVNFVGGNVFGYFDEEVFGVSLGFKDPLNATLTEEANISVWAQYDFPRPYPLWDEAPTDDDHPGYILEKVDYLPTHGVKLSTSLGFTFCWIERNILFMLILENSPTIDDALLLVSSLKSIQ